ncbi:MAG TPA: thioredoxin domain-containing protein [Acidobacteriota bacterium]|nr:thioredoxin domain-containing protein [Acidobacteriota bacterium]
MGEKVGTRILSFAFGMGMVVASAMTIRHFFMANYPTSIFQGSFCDINAFFNCDSSAFSVISQVRGVPLGYFGMLVGALVALGAVFPSAPIERTNKTISLFNVLGVIALLLFSVLYLKSLCLLCSGYYVFSIASFLLFAQSRTDADVGSFRSRYFQPSWKHVAAYAVLMLAGAWGFSLYHDARREAQLGVTSNIVKQYYALPVMKSPTVVSPFLEAQSTERFEDAPIRLIEYADFLCPDCLYLSEQLAKLREEFKGKINIAFQFFPLEAKCNDVVDKDKHPGACDLSYIAAYNPAKFAQIHDEIFSHFIEAKSTEWRRQLAIKYNAEAALTDPATKALVYRIIQTGREYERTSDKFPFGIRSTPTLILNNRLIIGTLPYAQLRAIFQALVEEKEGSNNRNFIENWVPTRP